MRFFGRAVNGLPKSACSGHQLPLLFTKQIDEVLFTRPCVCLHHVTLSSMKGEAVDLHQIIMTSSAKSSTYSGYLEAQKIGNDRNAACCYESSSAA